MPPFQHILQRMLGDILPSSHILQRTLGDMPPPPHILQRMLGDILLSSHILQRSLGDMPPSSHILQRTLGDMPPSPHVLQRTLGDMPPPPHILQRTLADMPRSEIGFFIFGLVFISIRKAGFNCEFSIYYISAHFTTAFTLFPPILMMTAVPDGRRLVMLEASLGLVAEPMSLPSME